MPVETETFPGFISELTKIGDPQSPQKRLEILVVQSASALRKALCYTRAAFLPLHLGILSFTNGEKAYWRSRIRLAIYVDFRHSGYGEAVFWQNQPNIPAAAALSLAVGAVAENGGEGFRRGAGVRYVDRFADAMAR